VDNQLFRGIFPLKPPVFALEGGVLPGLKILAQTTRNEKPPRMDIG